MAAVNEVSPRFAPAAAIEAIIDTIAASRLKSAIAILIVALACFLPGLDTLPPYDRDESHSILATQQMAETGNYADPRVHEEPARFLPIGLYWLETLAVRASGGEAAASIATYRLPSSLAAIAAALLTWWAALAFGRPRAALFAALFTAASFVLVSEAKVARADTLLLAAVVLAEGALARLWLKPDDRPDLVPAFLFWTGLGLGILAKGPIAPLVVGLTLAVLVVEHGGIGWLRRLAPLPGAIWLAFLLSPWLVSMLIAAAGDPIPERMLAETLDTQGTLEAPPGAYLVLFFLSFWPAAIFAVAAVPFVLDNSRRKLVVFMLAWAVPFWIVLELFPLKLPQYVMPIYPAIAILAATALDEGSVRLKGWFAWLLSLSLFLIPIALGAWLAVTLLDENRGMAVTGLVLVIAGVAVAVVAWRWLVAGGSQIGAAALSVAAAVIFFLAVFGVTVPSLGGLRLAERAIAAAHAALACSDPEFAAAGFREPSLLLAGHSKVRLTDGAGAADFIAGGRCRAAIIERRQQSTFNQRVEDLGLVTQLRNDVRGFNSGTLKQNALRIITVEGGGD